MFGDADLPTFFADFGVPVIFNGKTAMGNFDRPEQVKLADQGFGGVETAFPAVRLPYNAFAVMPVTGNTVTFDGCDYTVAERTTEADGGVICLELKKVGL